MNDQPPKKQYSLEENMKYISFGIKDIVKALQELVQVVKNQKNDGPSF